MHLERGLESVESLLTIVLFNTLCLLSPNLASFEAEYSIEGRGDIVLNEKGQTKLFCSVSHL